MASGAEDDERRFHGDFLVRLPGWTGLQPQAYPALFRMPPIEASRDFGRHFTANDADVRVARTTADVVEALWAARSMPGGLHLRGAGHSMNGQTLPNHGIQLHLRFEDEPGDFAVDGQGRVTVPGSASWERVLAEIEPRGRTIGMLTDHLEVTVGGTLSVSGVGPASYRYGRQVDIVDALELVLADGSVVWCDREERGDLFRAALAGLGGIGVIRRARLNTVTYRPYVVSVARALGTWDEAIVDAERIAAAATTGVPDELCEFMAGMGPPLASGGPAIATGLTFEFASAQEAIAFAKVGVDTQPLLGGGWSFLRVEERPNARLRFRTSIDALLYQRWDVTPPDDVLQFWGDFVLPTPTAARTLLDTIRDDLDAPAVAAMNFCRYGLLINETTGTPHLPLSFLSRQKGGAGYAFLQGMYFAVPREDEAVVAEIERLLDRARDVAFALGGRPYLYPWNSLDGEAMQTGYGESWEEYVTTKRTVDPECVLNRGFFARWGVTP